MIRDDLHRWISWQLFYQGSRDRLLVDLVRPLVIGLWGDGLIDSFFFIRYGLGGPHVRLRLRCIPGHHQAAGERVQIAATSFFQSWPSQIVLTEEEIHRINQNLLANDAFGEDRIFPNDSAIESPLHLEIERYGGETLAGHSLDVFALSSIHTLNLLETHAVASKGEVLSTALRLLARLSLALAWSCESFFDLVEYASVWSKGSAALLVQRGDEAFERASEVPCRILREEIECFQETSQRLTFVKGACRLARLTSGAEARVRREIAVGQMHMAANRLGLGNAEEIYLSRLLWRAAQQMRSQTPTLLTFPLEPAKHNQREDLQSLVFRAFCELLGSFEP
jgi:hypothetical protein